MKTKQELFEQLIAIQKQLSGNVALAQTQYHLPRPGYEDEPFQYDETYVYDTPYMYLPSANLTITITTASEYEGYNNHSFHTLIAFDTGIRLDENKPDCPKNFIINEKIIAKLNLDMHTLLLIEKLQLDLIASGFMPRSLAARAEADSELASAEPEAQRMKL